MNPKKLVRSLLLSGLALSLHGLATQAEEPRPAGPAGTVTLPLAEYDRLLERAAKPKTRPVPPPLPAALARAEARVSVNGITARGTLQLEGEVFASGTTRVPLFSGTTVLEAHAAGKAVPLLVEGGALSALLPGPGIFTLQLEWAATVSSEPGRAAFNLPVPRAGSVRAVIDVPGGQADVRVEPGIVTRRSASAGRTLLEVTLEPGRPTRVSWSARETAALPARPARLLSEVKTLLTLGDSDLQLAALVDVVVVEGEPEQFTLELPAGYELQSLSGATLESTAQGAGTLTLTVREPARRRHQFLLGLQRATDPGSFKAEIPFVSVRGVQRESGELALSGPGTIELTATEGGTLRRMDVGESAPALRALTGEPLLQAFRYQRRPSEGPQLTLDVKRFEPQAVLAALCERAVVTTLVTSEGRMLTEVKLTVRNHAQPFLKLGLRPGASLLSAQVAGQAVKPVEGQDGARVPLLRAGFRPSGAYEVSFVYLQPGEKLGKRGQAQLDLPTLDLAVSILEWELFLPERYEIKRWGGNVLRAEDAGMAPIPAQVATGLVMEAVQVVDSSSRKLEADSRQMAQPAVNAPSSNVFALQRLVAGVLPVRVDVPHAGESFRFVRALVLDEETTVSFNYNARGR